MPYSASEKGCFEMSSGKRKRTLRVRLMVVRNPYGCCATRSRILARSMASTLGLYSPISTHLCHPHPHFLLQITLEQTTHLQKQKPKETTGKNEQIVHTLKRLLVAHNERPDFYAVKLAKYADKMLKYASIMQ